MSTNEFYTIPKLADRNSFDKLKLQKGDIPKPGPGQVLVAVKAVSLNFRDLIIALNKYPGLPDEERVPASDGAGVVVEVGAGVNEWKKDDRVNVLFNRDHLKGPNPSTSEMATGHGGQIDGLLTRYKVTPAHSLVRIPDGFSFEEAATLPCAALTAWNSLYGLPSHAPKPGETIVAQGTGGVSVFAAQFAIAGGSKVVLTSSSDDKLARVRDTIPKDKQHLLHTFNYSKDPDWEKEVLKVSNGKGAAAIVEVGGAGTLEKSFQSIKTQGIIAAVGFVAGGSEFPNIITYMIRTGAIFRGILVGPREQFQDMNDAITSHHLKPIIDKVFDFKDAAKAYEYQWSRAHVGKVVIKID